MLMLLPIYSTTTGSALRLVNFTNGSLLRKRVPREGSLGYVLHYLPYGGSVSEVGKVRRGTRVVQTSPRREREVARQRLPDTLSTAHAMANVIQNQGKYGEG